MQIAVLKEQNINENRVSLTPDLIKIFQRLNLDVLVQDGAGITSGYPNELYLEGGAKIVSRKECLNSDICLCVRIPEENDLNNLKQESVLIGILNPYENKKYLNTLNNKKIISCCMELIPRISRAQSMDVLSSQANLAGYRSVIDAAEQFGKAFPMMMTAAGRVNPAKVMVLGVGVAGLQAIATAKRLGAIVSATDVRAASREQVESLGGKFLTVEQSENLETEGGYAKEASEDFKKKQAEMMKDALKKNDIVICTALVPGKTAPRIISEELVKLMRPGSIIYDLAVEQGGNSAFSEVGKINIVNGVKVIGVKNLMNRLPLTASSLYSKNLFSFIRNLYSKEKKDFNINMEDEIIEKTLIKEIK